MDKLEGIKKLVIEHSSTIGNKVSDMVNSDMLSDRVFIGAFMGAVAGSVILGASKKVVTLGIPLAVGAGMTYYYLKE